MVRTIAQPLLEPTKSLANSIGASLISAGNAKKVARHWEVYSQGNSQSAADDLRRKWRMAASFYLAETKDMAIEQTRQGLLPWLHYFQSVTPLKLIDENTRHEEAVMVK